LMVRFTWRVKGNRSEPLATAFLCVFVVKRNCFYGSNAGEVGKQDLGRPRSVRRPAPTTRILTKLLILAAFLGALFEPGVILEEC